MYYIFTYPFISWYMFWLFLLFGYLWIMLPWIVVYKFLCDICLHISWVELLGHMVTLCLTFWGTAKLSFPKWLNHFTFPPAVYEGSIFSISLSMVDTVFFIVVTAILVGVKWYLIMVCLWGFFVLFFGAVPLGMQDLSSPTRDWTGAPCSGSMES